MPTNQTFALSLDGPGGTTVQGHSNPSLRARNATTPARSLQTPTYITATLPLTNASDVPTTPQPAVQIAVPPPTPTTEPTPRPTAPPRARRRAAPRPTPVVAPAIPSMMRPTEIVVETDTPTDEA